MSRSQTKVENDYISEEWPTSAKILDINRCALQFETVASLMKFLKNFEVKVKNGTAGCVKEIIRCKNGWSVYNEQLPSYTDIKLNVLLQSEDGKSIIAEIQFLLDVMSAYKKIAHKLYAIERKYELVANYQSRCIAKVINCLLQIYPFFSAVVTNTNSSHTTGEECPRPGTPVFQRMFFVSLHSIGGLALGATPVACGPRHCPH